VIGLSGCRTLQEAAPIEPSSKPDTSRVNGVVYHDRNGNGAYDAGERGLSGVRVSNGREVVLTDRQGRYGLPVDDDTIIFVIKPAGWMTPVDERRLPRFYYVHKPHGSPPLKYAGVEPTGPLPASVDFPLHKQKDSKRFRIVVFGDTQPYSKEEVYLVGHDVVEELVGFDAAFGVSLGDLVGDDLSLFEPLTDVVKHVRIPWYNVLGNHDMNYDSPDDEHSTESFQRVFGPPSYSFEYGDVHFIVLDDVIWSGAGEDKKGAYRGAFSAEPLEFVKNDLALTPKDRLIVLMMHIPLVEVENRGALYDLLEDRPHTLSMAAHWHKQTHAFVGEDDGWDGPDAHHHFVNATVSGSWWRGIRDEEYIPHTTMRDGAPNGYSVITFDGHDYSIRFKVARRPSDHQMTIFAPDEVPLAEAADTEVVVNVFAGSPRSTVQMRVGDHGEWTAMTRVEREDPYYRLLKEAEAARGDTKGKLPRIEKSTHIWVAKLPATAQPGSHLIQVRTTDVFGQTYMDNRIIRIR
jgi:hypothetical protein